MRKKKYVGPWRPKRTIKCDDCKGTGKSCGCIDCERVNGCFACLGEGRFEL